MGKLFNVESPFWQGMSKLADLMMLNVLFILSCIPLVTVGAAASALYYSVHKLTLDEGNLWKNYWSAFRQNWKQATVLWLLLAVVGAGLLYSLFFYLQTGHLLMLALALVALALWCGMTAWSFLLLSRFENTAFGTLRNALLCALGYLPRTLVMILLLALPWVLFVLFPVLFLQLGAIWLIVYGALCTRLILRLNRKPLEQLMGPQEN